MKGGWDSEAPGLAAEVWVAADLAAAAAEETVGQEGPEMAGADLEAAAAVGVALETAATAVAGDLDWEALEEAGLAAAAGLAETGWAAADWARCCSQHHSIPPPCRSHTSRRQS